MSLIQSIDGPNRLIHLSDESLGVDVHPIDIYKDVRELRRSDESLRKYSNFMTADGNVPKGANKFTERYVTLLDGTLIVPYDTSHTLTITGTIITDDGEEGIACFDRTPLSPSVYVNIDYRPPQVEVIVVPTGSGVLPSDITAIRNAVWAGNLALTPEEYIALKSALD